jgi:hypothetical protein
MKFLKRSLCFLASFEIPCVFPTFIPQASFHGNSFRRAGLHLWMVLICKAEFSSKEDLTNRGNSYLKVKEGPSKKGQLIPGG